MSAKLLVGLTGGFGTGKSTVANLLRELGAAVIDSDQIVHEALMEGSRVYEQVSRLFPDAVTAGKAGLDRKKMAAVVFEDEKKRKTLEGILHPFVFDQIGERTAAAAERIVIAEVPLLFESGFHRYCEKVMVVTANDDQVTERLKEKSFSAEEVTKRREAQWPLSEKVKQADIIFDNSGTLEETKQRAKEVWKQLCSY